MSRSPDTHPTGPSAWTRRCLLALQQWLCQRREHRRRRADRLALQTMSDAELTDLGVGRGEIEAILQAPPSGPHPEPQDRPLSVEGEPRRARP